MTRWAQWGDGIPEILRGFILKPGQVVSALLGKGALQLFFSLLFLPFLTRWGWLLFIIPWVINTTSGNGAQSNLSLYYGIPVLTFAFLAAIQSLRSRAIRKVSVSRFAIAIPLMLFILNFSHFAFPGIDRTRSRFLRATSEIPATEKIQAMSCFFGSLAYERPKTMIQPSSELRERFLAIRVHSTTWPLSNEGARAI